MSKFYEYITESLWSEIRDRSNGGTKKIEDIIPIESIGKECIKKFWNFLDRFVEHVFYCEEYGITLSDFKSYIKKIGSYTFWDGNSRVSFEDKVLPYIEDNWNQGDNICKKITNKVLDEKIKVSKTGFKKKPGKTISETIEEWWDSLDDFIKFDIVEDTSAMEHAEEKFYETHLDDDEFTGEDLDVDELFWDCNWEEIIKIYLDNITKNESVWSDIRNRANGRSIKKEDDINLLDLEGLYGYIKDNYEDKVFFVDFDYFGQPHKMICVDPIENVSLYTKFDKETEKMTHILISLISNGKKICDDFIEKLQNRFYVELTNIYRIIVKEKDGSCTNKTYIDLINMFIENMDDVDNILTPENESVNESIWSDIRNRANGKTTKREDDVNLFSIDQLKKYILQKYGNSIHSFDMEPGKFYTNICDGCIELLKEFEVDNGDVKCIKVIVNPSPVLKLDIDDSVIDRLKEDYTVGIKHSGKIIITGKDFSGLSNLDYMNVLDILIENSDKVKFIYESVWSDIRDRANGESMKKEDEIPQDIKNVLCKYIALFPEKYNSGDYIDTVDDFVSFVWDFNNNREVEKIKVNTKDVVDFVKKNWDYVSDLLSKAIDLEDDGHILRDFTCDELWYMLTKKDINECDGVPGGLTPADVGGMGEITFPGADGTPGSGDIPMPTGHVYQQVAPFGIFINMKKRKKKKKFRKEDEPCSHSKNQKMYDYVDDYREYVDRTYNNMDRKK